LSDIAWITQEINRLTEMKKSYEKKVSKTESFVEKIIKPIYQWKKISYWNWSVSFKETESTIIENPDLIPDEYKVTNTIIEVKIPKDPIKKAIKEWKEIPWAKIQKNSNLTIK
jgi:hypothetical protein